MDVDLVVPDNLDGVPIIFRNSLNSETSENCSLETSSETNTVNEIN